MPMCGLSWYRKKSLMGISIKCFLSILAIDDKSVYVFAIILYFECRRIFFFLFCISTFHITVVVKEPSLISL